ncbi:MAG: MerR family transcriptional regulator [Chitinophagaceae bacterium]|nr:MerR family transcriptional regulator [Chitinophagaceae bacterium]
MKKTFTQILIDFDGTEEPAASTSAGETPKNETEVNEPAVIFRARPKPTANTSSPVMPVSESSPSRRGRKPLKEKNDFTSLKEPVIPDDDILYQKQYYGIGEVAEMFGVNASLIRFWESEFDILKPKKNKKGDRFFRPDDIKLLALIYDLLRRRKYTIEGAKEYLKKNSRSAEKFQAIQSLLQIKAFLLELKASL